MFEKVVIVERGCGREWHSSPAEDWLLENAAQGGCSSVSCRINSQNLLSSYDPTLIGGGLWGEILPILDQKKTVLFVLNAEQEL